MPRARPSEWGNPRPVPRAGAGSPAAGAPPPFNPAPPAYSPGMPYQYSPAQPAPPPPGWYRDPGGVHQYRFWNGGGWTPGVANGPYVTEDWTARPPVPGAWQPGAWQPAQQPDERAKLPPAAAAYAFGGIAAAVVLSLLGALIAGLAFPHNREALLLLSQGGLWSGLVGAVRLTSRRLGTGNVWRDFGVRIEPMDTVVGLVVSIAARFAGIILAVILALIDRRLIGSDLAPLRHARQDPVVLLTVVIFVVVGAPFIEELFFRGLLLRSLVPLLGSTGAIVVQGLVFGALHMRPSYALGNVSLFVVIGILGVCLGFVAEHYRRLGPGMVAHCLFNLVALLLAFAVRAL